MMDISVGSIAILAVWTKFECHSLVRLHTIVEVSILILKIPNSYLERWVATMKTIQIVEYVIISIHNKQMHPDGKRNNESINDIVREMEARG